MAMAEAQIAILKVIVAAQFFSSCYFKVQLLHNVTLITTRWTQRRWKGAHVVIFQGRKDKKSCENTVKFFVCENHPHFYLIIPKIMRGWSQYGIQKIGPTRCVCVSVNVFIDKSVCLFFEKKEISVSRHSNVTTAFQRRVESCSTLTFSHWRSWRKTHSAQFVSTHVLWPAVRSCAPLQQQNDAWCWIWNPASAFHISYLPSALLPLLT